MTAYLLRVLVILVFIFVSPLSFSMTLRVPEDYTSIQAAIDAAQPGDIVSVSSGTYVENIDFLGKAIVVESVGGAEVTVIDGGNPPDPDFGSVATFMSGEGNDSVLRGFTLTNGMGTQYEYTPGFISGCGNGVFVKDASPTICDCKIQSQLMKAMYGGGLLCLNASPVLKGNRICDNEAVKGGGMYLHQSSAIITDNLIDGNTAGYWGGTGSGGGIYMSESDPIISNNRISNNSTDYEGGGIAVIESFPLIEGNLIDDNSAYNLGGGISVNESYCSSKKSASDGMWIHGSDITSGNAATRTGPVIRNNRLLNNYAKQSGGAVQCYESEAQLERNEIMYNSAGLTGGGIEATNSLLRVSNCRISKNETLGMFGSGGGGGVCGHSGTILLYGCLIADNNTKGDGGALAASICPIVDIRNCTLVDNIADGEGGGISGWMISATLTNSIVWQNGEPMSHEIYLAESSYPSDMAVDHSNIKGGQSSIYLDPNCTLDWGAGMIDAVPQFADPAVNDYHLSYLSPCRNSGDNDSVVDIIDFEGDPRIAFGAVDMGADEFSNHFYCTGDFVAGGSMAGKFVGLPDTWPVGLFIGSGVIDPPMQHKWGDFHLESPWLLYPLPPIPSDGVLILEETLPGTPGPYDIPMQALIGWELSNPFVLEVR